MAPALFFLTVRAIAALPEPERRQYVRAYILAEVDPAIEQLIIGALPARSAAAARQLLTCLREWS